MTKNLATLGLFLAVFFVGSASFAQSYNNSFNNNSGTINIYGGGQPNYGYGYTGYTVPVYPVQPTYTYPTYVYPTYGTYYYTYPTYTVPVAPYYGHGTIRIRGRW